MSTPSASKARASTLTVHPPSVSSATIERFRGDLGDLIHIDRDRVLVALSGGSDSVALLLLASAALGERCYAATVDHELRPASAQEALFASRLCADHGIPHAILTGTLPHRIGRTANLSARARALRYELLHDHAQRIRAEWIATAHHADDQLETLVMRINRGTGVAGLAGIRPTGWRVIRPLLAWRRAELAAVTGSAGIAAIDDPSNADDRFDRARLRKALGAAPWLDAAGLAASTDALAQAEEALAWTMQRLLIERIVEDEDAILLDPTDIPAELLRRLVRACVTQIDVETAPDGPALGRLIARLVDGQHATLGKVAAAPGRRWRFATAPSRRSAGDRSGGAARSG